MSTLGKIDSLIAQGAKDIFMHAKIYADLRLIDRDEIEIITARDELVTGHMANRKSARLFVSRYYGEPESVDINEVYGRIFNHDCDIWISKIDTVVLPIFRIPLCVGLMNALRVSYYELPNGHKAIVSVVGEGRWVRKKENESPELVYGVEVFPEETKPYDGDWDLSVLSSPKTK